MRGKNFHSRTTYDQQQQQLRTFNKLPNLLHFVVVHVMPGNIRLHLKFSERSNTFQHEIWRVSQVLKVVSLAKKRKLDGEQGKKEGIQLELTHQVSVLACWCQLEKDTCDNQYDKSWNFRAINIHRFAIHFFLFFLVFTSLLVFHFTKLNLGTSFLINFFLFTLLWNCARVECPF